MSQGYEGKTSALQALDSDRLNFVAGWISHAVECTKFFADANSFVDAGKTPSQFPVRLTERKKSKWVPSQV